MRTFSKREVDQLSVSGATIRKLTETPKPPAPIPEIPDHAPHLAALEARDVAINSRVEEVALVTGGELSRQGQMINHLMTLVHALKNELSIKRIPPQMQISRGTQGFISAVTCGGLVFKFNRNRIGSVESIDVLTTT